MKKNLINLLLLLAISNFSALKANDKVNKGYYLNLLGGGNLLHYSKKPDKNKNYPLKFEKREYGFLIGGSIGYHFSEFPLRMEAEYNYRKISIFSNEWFAHSFMGNIYYDFDIKMRFFPYLGIGLGVTKNHFFKELKEDGTLVNARYHNKIASALQTKIGITYSLCKKTEIGLEYSYLYNFFLKEMRNQTLNINIKRYL